MVRYLTEKAGAQTPAECQNYSSKPSRQIFAWHFYFNTPVFESQAESAMQKGLAFFMLNSLSKSERKRERKRHTRYLKILFAAYHFLNTSRDGAVIAQIVGAKPIDLYRWSEGKNWTNAIQYWNPEFKGDTQLQGEYFLSVVGDRIVQRSLKRASRLWKALLQGRETRELQKTLNMFDDMGFTE